MNILFYLPVEFNIIGQNHKSFITIYIRAYRRAIGCVGFLSPQGFQICIS